MLNFFTKRAIEAPAKPIVGGSPDTMLQSALQSRNFLRTKLVDLALERERIDIEFTRTQLCLDAASAAIAVLDNFDAEITEKPLDIKIEDFMLEQDEIGEPLPIDNSEKIAERLYAEAITGKDLADAANAVAEASKSTRRVL